MYKGEFCKESLATLFGSIHFHPTIVLQGVLVLKNLKRCLLPWILVTMVLVSTNLIFEHHWHGHATVQ